MLAAVKHGRWQASRIELGCVIKVREALKSPDGRVGISERLVGEHEAQLPWSRLSQSISPFAPSAFTGFVANMERSDFPVGVVRLSLPPSGFMSCGC